MPFPPCYIPTSCEHTSMKSTPREHFQESICSLCQRMSCVLQRSCCYPSEHWITLVVHTDSRTGWTTLNKFSIECVCLNTVEVIYGKLIVTITLNREMLKDSPLRSGIIQGCMHAFITCIPYSTGPQQLDNVKK